MQLATVDIAQERLDEAAARLAVAEAHVRTTPPDRRRRLQVAIASLKLSLAGRRGNFASVVEQARFLASPLTGPSDEDIALGSDLRAVALMNLGIVEEWSLGLPDAERHPGYLACRARPPPRRLPPAGPAGRGRRQLHPHPLNQPVTLALAQLIGEFAHTPGTLPATLLALPPQQAAPEETFMEVTRDAADGRTQAANGELAAAAFVMGRRGT
jgi:hypothetical protein